PLGLGHVGARSGVERTMARAGLRASALAACAAAAALLAGPRGSLALNRLLLERHELLPGACGGRRAVLPLADPRASHVARVLRLQDGDTVRVGVLDGGIDDAAAVRWLWPDGREDDGGRWSGRASQEQRPERLRQETLHQALELEEHLPQALELTFDEGAQNGIPPPRVDLLLASPEPARLQRLLPMLTQLGLGTVVLCTVARVGARGGLGAHWLRSSEAVRELLVPGLAQSGDVRVPRVVVGGRLRPLLQRGDLESALQASGARAARLYVSPRGPRFCELPATAAPQGGRLLVAVGPDGGWRDPEETEMLSEAGFLPVSTGPRCFNVEVAACTALALSSGAIRRWDDAR
ncbi:unnamed protein product, partial [Prorocentrum cordatum]